MTLTIALILLLISLGKQLSIHEGLRRIAKGEMLDDLWSRSVYSVDASHYEVTPEAVVFPVDADDVRQICRYCTSGDYHIVARGAGTGLLGQSLSDGIILDFTKHMNKVLEIGEDYVIAQPGVVKGLLDRELKKRHKFLPPDPASSNYCTVGGMIANNSSGIHCLGYGNTIDFVEAVQFIYADGSEGYANSASCDNRVQKLKDLLLSNSDLILSSYPKVAKNSCGYRLDSVIRNNAFLPHKILAASEGTLGVFTEAKLRILDLPEQRSLLVIGFPKLQDAVSAVPVILRHSPVALEMLDHTALTEGDNDFGAGCLLFVEFAGSSRIPEQRLASCRDALKGSCSVLEYASDETSLTRMWAARKGALNNIMKLTVGSRKPVGLIEDTVVPPEALGEYAEAILNEYRQKRLPYVMYGHVGDGNIHTRPIVDTDSAAQVQLLKEIAARVFSRALASGGSITGEHGDGIARTPYIEMQYGAPVTKIFQHVKELFDPQYILNPGKKVPAPGLQ